MYRRMERGLDRERLAAILGGKWERYNTCIVESITRHQTFYLYGVSQPRTIPSRGT
jgi:hypothetical protein